ncbi:4a-hydroxytetrahydrobiopterin dehydratase [Paeniglutamicibacter gangotriensis]|uniref:Putative pterin-4-alpha-carbinolamine dehydratase n=1 Tax=Paeniglutamicibacter gangotriensis Lz1y TaxID=1276920 RepID=M7NM93_9MICC|nr:4a-hydroxytetrahydrobiopterin dehydratase [Paeniglutamicibacter gangotriensis]EMQ99658.1 Putative pterin-4-alpha-carbinolamine dehydratase [Paeniglutamicibacter gangotriensis Lz1y]
MALEKDSPNRILTDYEVARALKELPSWRERDGALVCAWAFADTRDAIDFLALVAEAAEHQGHHPDVDWRATTIFLRSTSHDVGDEITLRDVALATLLEFAATDSGAVAVPNRHQDLRLGFETGDPERLSEFWAGAMGYSVGRDEDLVDPEGRNPRIRISSAGNPQEHGIHIERLIAHSSLEDARQKLEQAQTSGAPVHGPSGIRYTDADGNRLYLDTEYREETPEFQ